MQENTRLFENAKFGDKYVSRDGKLNIFCHQVCEQDIILVRESYSSPGFTISVDEYGRENCGKFGESSGDIISRYTDD